MWKNPSAVEFLVLRKQFSEWLVTVEFLAKFDFFFAFLAGLIQEVTQCGKALKLGHVINSSMKFESNIKQKKREFELQHLSFIRKYFIKDNWRFQSQLGVKKINVTAKQNNKMILRL